MDRVDLLYVHQIDPVTPLEEAITHSVALYRERLDAGQLDPAKHGLG